MNKFQCPCCGYPTLEARRFGTIDKELVLPIVYAGLQDESAIVKGHADSALDDIQMFAL